MISLFLLGNAEPYQMFGAVVLTENKTLVIDGGLVEDAPGLLSLLRDKGREQIDAWFFTHPHHDHIGAFFAFRKRWPQFPIHRIYHHFPSEEMLKICPAHRAHDGIERQMWDEIYPLMKKDFPGKVCIFEKGDQFSFDRVTLHVLRVMNPAFDPKRNFINNSSAVFRLDSPTKRVLFLGDLGVEGGEELMAAVPACDLAADYTQMAHHGQLGVDRKCYEYIQPRRCLWPTPALIWDNVGPEGPGSGKWKTAETRAWMDEMGVVEHIIAKDGTREIQL